MTHPRQTVEHQVEGATSGNEAAVRAEIKGNRISCGAAGRVGIQGHVRRRNTRRCSRNRICWRRSGCRLCARRRLQNIISGNSGVEQTRARVKHQGGTGIVRQINWRRDRHTARAAVGRDHACCRSIHENLARRHAIGYKSIVGKLDRDCTGSCRQCAIVSQRDWYRVTAYRIRFMR
ncbi:MAG: hypothetical protein ALAOOOJD_03788 [bacterium]|nr:hypothetical protein [bacterium]